MNVEYVGLADYVALAAEITGLDVDAVMRVAKLDLADSAKPYVTTKRRGDPVCTPRLLREQWRRHTTDERILHCSWLWASETLLI